MQYTETQLTQLIADVEREFNAHLAKAEEGAESPLAKAEGAEKKPFPPKKEGESKEAKPEGEAEAKPEQKPEGEAKPAEGAPAKEAAAPTPEAAPEAAVGAAGSAGHGYDDEDMAHLEKMYMSMSQDELKLHHDVLKKCLDKCMGMDGMGKSEAASEVSDENKLSPKPHVKGANLDSDPKNGGIEGQEPHNSPGAKDAASNANGAKINKSEAARRNGGKIEAQAPHNSPGAKDAASDANGAKMNKSEQGTEAELLKSELGAVNAKYDDLKKNFDAVAAFLTKLVEKRAAPAAKAITSLEVIAKGEEHTEEKPLTKSEVSNVLLKKSQDPKTSKADRDAINNFYLSGGSIESISHLLK